MDGLSSSIDMTLAETQAVSRIEPSHANPGYRPLQHTLKNKIDCVGIGLHGGKRASLTLNPAAPNTGIMFRRTDLGAGSPDILARHDFVSDTRLCTVLENPAHPGARVGTAEHVLAALAGLGVQNAVIELDGPEVPILDGSAEGFAFLIDCAGIAEQDATAPAIEILRPVRVSVGEAHAELLPGGPGFDMTLSIDFEAAAIGRQSASITLTPASFRAGLARARTFTLASEVESLREAGLALGGSLDNAVVVDGAKICNHGGLRMTDEFVRHKLLDAVGDLSLAGVSIHGRFVGHRSGHALNNMLLRKLFADDANWAPVFRYAAPLTGMFALNHWREGRLQAAAAPV